MSVWNLWCCDHVKGLGGKICIRDQNKLLRCVCDSVCVTMCVCVCVFETDVCL